MDETAINIKDDFGSSKTQARAKSLSCALAKTRELLHQTETPIGEDEIHAVKSLLYAAIERLGFTIERLGYSQRLLRELLHILALHADLRESERQTGLHILEELSRKLKRVF